MEIVLIILLISVVLGGGFFVVTKLGKSQNSEEALRMFNESFNARMREMADQFNAQTREVGERLKENATILQKSNATIGERLDNASRVVGTVTERLGKMEESSKRIFEVGKDISSLQDILRAPKLRGSLGEFFLGDLLSQYFPKDKYTMQYAFRSGEKVDAALHLADNKIVPIDAKFPLENFKKMIATEDEKEKKQHHKLFMSDVKRRIDEIARYILPDEGTMDFALLYIPAENVYYEVIVKDENEENLSSYAFAKRVIPVSPNNFFVYLQTVLMGLRGLQIEHGAQEIQAGLIRLKGDFEKFAQDFEILGNHLTNSSNKYELARRHLDKFGTKLENVELLGKGEKPDESPVLLPK